MVGKLTVNENNDVTGVEFKDGTVVNAAAVCFAVSHTSLHLQPNV